MKTPLNVTRVVWSPDNYTQSKNSKLLIKHNLKSYKQMNRVSATGVIPQNGNMKPSSMKQHLSPIRLSLPYTQAAKPEEIGNNLIIA
jgi:hypothetical protein